ncbi:hypothetical protein [Anatilimnocola floriformis]|uniref:hypothetical protein n=1 Tax=Anatilimnocola floriformis TaxID=2948575 RepID=UPI0020C1E062|nr:hypothetical protein [Anatilimnocola floriformis]
MNHRICHCCWLPLFGGLLAGSLFAQDTTSSRWIAEAPAKSPFREREIPKVEAFDRLRALAERDSLAAGNPTHYPVKPVALVTAQQPVAPPATLPQTVVQPTQTCCEADAQIPARQWRQAARQEQWTAAREMYPHHAYQAPYGGAYYFRPYQAQHIGRQAEIIGNWGGDRANPYDNRFLQAIYAQPAQ